MDGLLSYLRKLPGLIKVGEGAKSRLEESFWHGLKAAAMTKSRRYP
jgi:hypothetical protein